MSSDSLSKSNGVKITSSEFEERMDLKSGEAVYIPPAVPLRAMITTERK